MDWASGVPDFLLNYIVEIVMAFAIAFLLPKVYDLLKMKSDDKRRELVETALRNGLLWALQQARLHSTRTSGVPSATTVARDPEDRLRVLSAAADYVLSGTSGTLKKLGVNDRTLRQRLEARLPDAVATVEKTTHLL